jgi:hypothetical protein
VCQQEAQKVTKVGGPLPAHKHTTLVRGPGSASCTGKLTYGQPLSSTHTPGTQA